MTRAMVEDETVRAVMGNHEFNATLWATEKPDRTEEYFREHREKSQKQHAGLLKAVGSLNPDPVKEQERSIVEWSGAFWSQMRCFWAAHPRASKSAARL